VLTTIWERWREQSDKRRTLRLLRTLDAHSLTDMGFEPAEIYGTTRGTIDEIHGDAWKGLKH
jgi:uncharacterized protein YjiS (DUF1127 family)